MEDSYEILEKLRNVIDREIEFQTQNKEVGKRTGNFNFQIKQAKYAGQTIYNNIKKDLFILVEQIGDDFYAKIFTEDNEFLGAIKLKDDQELNKQQLTGEDILLSYDASQKSEEEKKQIREKITRANTEGESIEKLTEKSQEKEQNKCEKIKNDLSEKSPYDFEITNYRKIIEPSFREMYPNTCEGAIEVGVAYSRSQNTFILVADYGKGFERAKNSELGIGTFETVTNVSREQDNVREMTPTALIKINEPGKKYEEGLSVEVGQYGYINAGTQRKVQGKRIGEDLAQEGEGTGSTKRSYEGTEKLKYGEDNYTLYQQEILSGNRNNALYFDIIDEIITKNSEKLDKICGENRNEKIMYVDRALKNKINSLNSQNINAKQGDTLKGILVNSVSQDIEAEKVRWLNNSN
ncbi:MAG: hypothetical protein IJV31_02960 [Clostridia bacterium]|nr:hypothetical protein [Clostridia bacterium]